MNFPKNFITGAMSDLESWGGIVPPSREALIDVLNFENEFEQKWQNEFEVFSYDSPESGDHGLDTAIRDVIFDAIAYRFTGMMWPLNGNSEEYKESFYTAIKPALDEAGWKHNL